MSHDAKLTEDDVGELLQERREREARALGELIRCAFKYGASSDNDDANALVSAANDLFQARMLSDRATELWNAVNDATPTPAPAKKRHR